MKVYSSVKKPRKSIVLPEGVKQNLESLTQLLKQHHSPSLSLTPSVQSFDGQTEALALARQFIGALDDPYRTMLLYPLVLDSPYAYTADPLLNQTTFPSELHPLLSLYLHKASGYAHLERQGRRLIDIFYHFLSIEASQVIEQWLVRNQNNSLGEWFFSECIAGFFQLLFRQKNDYTLFLTQFLRHGIAYLLLAALSCIRKKGPPEAEDSLVERIRVCYVIRYKLENVID